MAAHTRALEPLGRDDELARIDAFLTHRGTGGAALVLEGEAGIGKTTPWSADVERARDCGFRVLVAHVDRSANDRASSERTHEQPIRACLIGLTRLLPDWGSAVWRRTSTG